MNYLVNGKILRITIYEKRTYFALNGVGHNGLWAKGIYRKILIYGFCYRDKYGLDDLVKYKIVKIKKDEKFGYEVFPDVNFFILKQIVDKIEETL